MSFAEFEDEPTERSLAAVITIATNPSIEEIRARQANCQALQLDSAANRITLGYPGDGRLDRMTPLFTDLRQQASNGWHMNGSGAVPVFADMAGVCASLSRDATDSGFTVQNNSTLINKDDKVASSEDQTTVINQAFDKRMQLMRFVGFALGSFVPGGSQDSSGVAAINSGCCTIENTSEEHLGFGDFVYFEMPKWKPGNLPFGDLRQGSQVKDRKRFGRPVLKLWKPETLYADVTQSSDYSKAMANIKRPAARSLPPSTPLTTSVGKVSSLLSKFDPTAEPNVLQEFAVQKIFASKQQGALDFLTLQITVLTGITNTLQPFLLNIMAMDEDIRRIERALIGNDTFLQAIKNANGIQKLAAPANADAAKAKGLYDTLKPFLPEDLLISSTIAATYFTEHGMLENYKKAYDVGSNKDILADFLTAVANRTSDITTALAGSDIERSGATLDAICGMMATCMYAFSVWKYYALLVFRIHGNTATFDADFARLEKEIDDKLVGLLSPCESLWRFMINGTTSLPNIGVIRSLSGSTFTNLVEQMTGDRGWMLTADILTWLQDGTPNKYPKMKPWKLYAEYRIITQTRDSVTGLAKLQGEFYTPAPLAAAYTGQFLTAAPLSNPTTTVPMKQLEAIIAAWMAFAGTILNIVAHSNPVTVAALRTAPTAFAVRYMDDLTLLYDIDFSRELLANGSAALDAIDAWKDRAVAKLVSDKAAADKATAEASTLLAGTKDALDFANAQIVSLQKSGVTTVDAHAEKIRALDNQVAELEVQLNKLQAERTKVDATLDQTKYDLVISKAEATAATTDAAKQRILADRRRLLIEGANTSIQGYTKGANTLFTELQKVDQDLRTAIDTTLSAVYQARALDFLTRGSASHNYPTLKVIKGGGPGQQIDITFT